MADFSLAKLKPAEAMMPVPLSQFRDNATEQWPLRGDVIGSELELRQTLAVDGGSSPDTRNAQMITSVRLPNSYIAGGDISLKLTSALTATVNTSAFIDATCHKKAMSGAKSGVDLVTTDQQDVNRTTFAEDIFTINGAALGPGDELLIALKMSLNDTGASGGGDKFGRLTAVVLAMNTRGGLIA